MRIQGEAYRALEAGIHSVLARGLNSPRFKSETLVTTALAHICKSL